MQNGKVAHSFSPAFQDLTAYGDNKKEGSPSREQRPEPYAKRADPSQAATAKTLSPEVRKNSWVISPASSMNNILQAKKDENRRRKSVFAQALPVSRKYERTFQLLTTTEANQQQIRIQVLQEADMEDDEEEKLPPTPVASFLAQETGDDKFPWAFVNAETGLEVAFYKHKTTDFASHLDQADTLRKNNQLDLELYGKTPLYETQKYRKKSQASQEIIYHWASTKIKHASKMFGFISFSEAIEMSTKHETPQEFRLVKDAEDSLSGNFKVMWGVKKKEKEAAVGEIMGGRLQLTIKPKVDPTLIIIFLAMTKTLTPIVTEAQ